MLSYLITEEELDSLDELIKAIPKKFCIYCHRAYTFFSHFRKNKEQFCFLGN